MIVDNEPTMNFDTFLGTVGDWGRFQKVKYTIICLTYMLPPIMVYTYTFTAAVPEHRCQHPELKSNDSFNKESNDYFTATYQPTSDQCKKLGLLISINECQNCYIRSTSKINRTNDEPEGKIEKCNKYVFSKEHYKNTLVEEVKLIKNLE